MVWVTFVNPGHYKMGCSCPYVTPIVVLAFLVEDNLKRNLHGLPPLGNYRKFIRNYRNILENIDKYRESIAFLTYLRYLLINYWLKLVNSYIGIIINIIFG